jgi:heme-degrading monooxygenase HmoA
MWDPDQEEMMYGTIARLRVKPGSEKKLLQISRDESALQIPGYIAQYVYQTDNDPHEYYLVVLFENRETYFANANSPDQDARYREFRALLEEDPDWHDGEVVFSESR